MQSHRMIFSSISNNYIEKRTYAVLFCSLLLYGSESYTLSEIDKKTLDSVEM